jgi:hypothetical protein
VAPSVATDEQNILILEVFTYQQQMFSPVPPWKATLSGLNLTGSGTFWAQLAATG